MLVLAVLGVTGKQPVKAKAVRSDKQFVGSGVVLCDFVFSFAERVTANRLIFRAQIAAYANFLARYIDCAATCCCVDVLSGQLGFERLAREASSFLLREILWHGGLWLE